MIQHATYLALALASIQTGPADGSTPASTNVSLPDEAPLEAVLAREQRVQSQTDNAGIVVPRDTPVHLMVLSEVTTKTHSAGHRFKLRVIEPVIIDGKVVIPIGAVAWGQVTNAEGSGNLGKSGSLEAELLYLEAGGTQVRIDGQTRSEGNDGTAETVMGVLGLGIFGLFAKGNNAKIKAGEKFTAFTVEDSLIPIIVP
jgi:hypothetical protein